MITDNNRIKLYLNSTETAMIGVANALCCDLIVQKARKMHDA